MTNSVTIVDYQLGNIKSVFNACEHLGSTVIVTDNPKEVESAHRLIIPGVGAFGVGMANLKERGLDEAITNYVLTGRPLLGICLGFQMLCSVSEEFGNHIGLNLFNAKVMRFPETLRLPHVGWAPIESSNSDSGLFNLQQLAHYYFIHSYCITQVLNADTIHWSNYYNIKFVASCSRGNVFGVQFHPEKSGVQGLNLLSNFLKK